MTAAPIRLLFGLFALTILGHPVPVHAGGRAGDDVAMLAGIAEVEDWRGQRGSSGEIGPHQMMPGTWASYAGTTAERAVKHLAKIRSELQRHGAAVVPFNIALCWNAGIGRALSGRAELRHYDYARRVCARLEATKD